MHSVGKLIKAYIAEVIVGKEKVLVDTICQKVCAKVGILQSEKHFQTYLVTHSLSVFIALAELVYSVLPAVEVGDGTVSVKKVVGDDNAIIARCFITSCLLCSACRGTAAALGGMQVCFIPEHQKSTPLLMTSMHILPL